jgi:copper chaperone NosL
MGGITAMVDFYKWGYDYGHNLDPKAAIQVPGLSYQPPLFGHKTLLNFDAYSYPDVGGWVIIICATMFFIVWGYEWYKSRKRESSIIKTAKRTIPAAALMMFLFTSCTAKPQPFAYGKDICDDCKMTIMDPKFGGEIITKKGKIYKFDDAHCLVNFMKGGTVKEADVAQTVFIDYENDHSFLDVKTSYFVTSDGLKSPMNSNTAAFSSKEKANEKAKQTNGIVKDWPQLQQSL